MCNIHVFQSQTQNTIWRLFAVCGRTRNFLRLLADRILIFLRVELLADKAQFNFFSPLACSCGARNSCATSCACIIFGLYCIVLVKPFGGCLLFNILLNSIRNRENVLTQFELIRFHFFLFSFPRHYKSRPFVAINHR